MSLFSRKPPERQRLATRPGAVVQRPDEAVAGRREERPEPKEVDDDERDRDDDEKASFPSSSVPTIAFDETKQDKYKTVAQAVGFAPAELIRNLLLQFLKSEGIKIHNYDEVETFLIEKKDEADTPLEFWCWRPLREKDIITGFVWGQDDDENWQDGMYDSDDWDCRPWENLLPLHALSLIASIDDKFGDEVKFFVSDCGDLSVPPFLMVRPAKCNAGADNEYCLILDTRE